MASNLLNRFYFSVFSVPTDSRSLLQIITGISQFFASNLAKKPILSTNWRKCYSKCIPRATKKTVCTDLGITASEENSKLIKAMFEYESDLLKGIEKPSPVITSSFNIKIWELTQFLCVFS